MPEQLMQTQRQAVFCSPEIGAVTFDGAQAHLLHALSENIAAIGGPQASGAGIKAALAATVLKGALSTEQLALTSLYADGIMSLLVFDGMDTICATAPPAILPTLPMLENRHDVLCLAARNQILLALVDHRAFAYDIDNEGKLVRLVANFKGGGATQIMAEPEHIEISSHSGRLLGPHTEAPYWCAVRAENGHSPAPSALILSSLWNPGMEPTAVIPLAPLLDHLDAADCLALTSGSFNFTRSDSFVDGRGEGGNNVSILEFNERTGFTARFNSYRFSVSETASAFAKNAFQKLLQAIGEVVPYQYALSQQSAMLINNNRALHCRDVVRDNRRLLVRLFGLSRCSEAIVIADDPLLLRG